MTEIAQQTIRFITATSLFDGHDASINIMRRILQSKGAEVIHLGHNRGVDEIVQTAIQEDAHGIAVSSYQGGHIEFFKYMIDLLEKEGVSHIKVFAGGGGVIIPQEISELMEYGVARIYSPEDGRKMGLEGMIEDMIEQCRFSTLPEHFTPDPSQLQSIDNRYLGKCITWLESNINNETLLSSFFQKFPKNSEELIRNTPVVGLTGTGGSGKSCLTDNFVRNFLDEYDSAKIGIISVDPTKRKTSGALLGDRLRMNSIHSDRVFMRSLATRTAHRAISTSLEATISLFKNSGFDLILVETAGIGQSDSDITDMVDVSVYVMTPEFGAATQLEKIDMLDYADLIVVNKLDKPSGEDALNAVRKQYQRNHNLFSIDKEKLPVFGTIGSTFNDAGTNYFYDQLMDKLVEEKGFVYPRKKRMDHVISLKEEIIPVEQSGYLAFIVSTIKSYYEKNDQSSAIATNCYQLYGTLRQLHSDLPAPFEEWDLSEMSGTTLELAKKYQEKVQGLSSATKQLLQDYWDNTQNYKKEFTNYQVRGKSIEVENHHTTLSGLKIPKIATPRYQGWGDLLSWLGKENFPGYFPFTAGVFPFKRQGEAPTRMFAGEGIAERTNRRFHYVSAGQPAARLSTAFDSVTLYGANPAIRPDIYGKIGNSGVSICTVDDAKRLYSGFDLCSPSTSVSLTINGPAPMILAFFLNATIDQQVEKYLQAEGRLDQAKKQINQLYQTQGLTPPVYRNELPPNHDQLGLQTLGVSGRKLIPEDIYQNIKNEALSAVRGTVQADILKEDQAQNTCIFSTVFAMKLMGDIQEYFTLNQVRNFYSVSISGYHIAEAGANPITQVAFTLANGFTIIEYYLARGLKIDDFANNLSFFFSNGMDPEYSVIGRVARRIFAIALRDRYGANIRSQKLKYHIQTSGRSLHAQEIEFNDIRTTLQALYAVYDNCNSLHTNAYDEAITTPTTESVRRALAVQLIINQESGLVKNENSLQGSFIIEELTDLVEEAILQEFLRISERGGVLGAMETMYQRNKIQEESMFYEHLKHSGELPIIGVNTFLNESSQETADNMELARSDEGEKQAQLDSLEQFHQFHQQEADQALDQIRTTCKQNGNLFGTLMDAVQVCSLGQISTELYLLGGEYRRNT